MRYGLFILRHEKYVMNEALSSGMQFSEGQATRKLLVRVKSRKV